MKHWRGGIAAALVTAGTIAAVILDLTSSAFRHWWAERALTTGTVTGMLLILITVLVVNQVLSVRQSNDRSVATAAQAAIVMSQAKRASDAASAALDGSGDRDNASHEVRTFMTMILIAAPVLIEDEVPRKFLERAQHLGGELVRTLATIGKTPGETAASRTQLDEAVKQIRKASMPLLATLNPAQKSAAAGSD